MGGVLPVDLVLEILHRLPVKSLLRFQSVTKSWCRYMHDPDFIARHIRQVAESNSFTIITTNYDADVSFSRIDSPPNLLTFSCKANQDLEVTGSCNGLLCLLFQNRFVIISNLLIEDQHVIPIPPSTPCKEIPKLIQVGFGYDSVKDDYKVVMIVVHMDRKSGRGLAAEASIYSLRCNIWSQTKRLELNSVSTRKEFPFLGLGNGVVVSGALHWLPVDICYRFTIAFHLTTEEFYEMSLPDQVSEDGMMIYSSRMGVLNGCLCVSGYFPNQPYHDIWVMKEYGIHTSWTKLFRFMPSLGGSHNKVFALTPLIHFKKEGQVLLLQEDLEKCYSFYWYDMSDKKQMECEMPYKPICFCNVNTICSSTIVRLSDYRALWEENSSIWKGRLRKRRRKEDSSSRGTDKIGDDVEKQALKAFLNLRNQFIEGFSCIL